jgi:hypothetical protein
MLVADERPSSFIVKLNENDHDVLSQFRYFYGFYEQSDESKEVIHMVGYHEPMNHHNEKHILDELATDEELRMVGIDLSFELMHQKDVEEFLR